MTDIVSLLHAVAAIAIIVCVGASERQFFALTRARCGGGGGSGLQAIFWWAVCVMSGPDGDG